MGACWDRGPDLDLDQGLTIFYMNKKKEILRVIEILEDDERAECFVHD